MPADERSLSEGKTIAGKLLPVNENEPVSLGDENTRTDKPGSHKGLNADEIARLQKALLADQQPKDTGLKKANY